jgi:hypothetical protein
MSAIVLWHTMASSKPFSVHKHVNRARYESDKHYGWSVGFLTTLFQLKALGPHTDGWGKNT